MTESGFKFYLINDHNVPRKYLDYNNHYYDFSMPVLCKVEDSYVYEIHFLKDITTCNTKEALTGFSFVIDESTLTSELLFNGRTFIDSAVDGGISAKDLAHLLAKIVSAKKVITKLNQTIKYLDPDDPQRRKQVIKDFEKIINSFDINNILSSLNVEVSDYLRTKRGDDDTYYIYRKAELTDKSVIIDNYIDNLIGIGEKCIYKDSGYTNKLESYANSFLEEHPLGVYKGEMLEKEKARIVSMYSKEEHMANLFFEQLDKQKKALTLLSKWNILLDSSTKELKEKYLTKGLMSLEPNFFYDFSSRGDHHDILNSLNKYLQRLQLNLPILNVLISGNTPLLDEKYNNKYNMEHGMWYNDFIYYKKIGSVLEDLCKQYHVILITGNAKGAEALSLKYALEHKIEFRNGYTEWTMLGRDKGMNRACEMVEKADLVVLTGEYGYYLSQNILKVAKEVKVPVKFIQM